MAKSEKQKRPALRIAPQDQIAKEQVIEVLENALARAKTGDLTGTVNGDTNSYFVNWSRSMDSARRVGLLNMVFVRHATLVESLMVQVLCCVNGCGRIAEPTRWFNGTKLVSVCKQHRIEGNRIFGEIKLAEKLLAEDKLRTP